MAKQTAKRGKKTTNLRFSGFLICLGVILLGLSGWGWWHYVYNSPRRVIWAMFDNTLKTAGITAHSVQSSGSQTLEEYSQLQTGASPTVHAVSTLTQGEQANTVVDTEKIGTPYADYVRYTNIKTDQAYANGQKLDFSSVLNTWGASSENLNATDGQSYSGAVLSALPFARLSAEQRHQVLRLMKDAYTIDYASVRHERQNGRPVYIYTMTLNPQAYVAMLKRFAGFAGLQQLDTVDPAAYQNVSPVELQISVDVWSRQPKAIRYTDSDRQETYSGFGIYKPKVQKPRPTIPVDMLEQNLQAILE